MALMPSRQRENKDSCNSKALILTDVVGQSSSQQLSIRQPLTHPSPTAGWEGEMVKRANS